MKGENYHRSNPILRKLESIVRKSVYLYILTRYVSGKWLYKLLHEDDFDAFVLLDQYIEEDKIFLDIGANDGISAKLMLSNLKKRKIFSIEANPGFRKTLQKIKRSRKSRFDFRIVGASDKPSELTLYVPKFRKWYLSSFASTSRENISQAIFSSFGKDEKKLGITIEKRQIEVINVDSLDLNPGMIKIDVEGLEHKVINGLNKTLTNSFVEVIMVEYNKNNIHELISNLGDNYFVSIFDPRRSTFTPFNQDIAPTNIFFIRKNFKEKLPNSLFDSDKTNNT